MTKKELVLKAFHNEKTDRVPVGFWFHYLENELLDGFTEPALIEENRKGQEKFYRDFEPDFVKIMTDGFFVYPNPLLACAQKAAELAALQPLGPQHLWITRQVEFAKSIAALYQGQIMSFYNIFAPINVFRFCRPEGAQSAEDLFARFYQEDRKAITHAMNVVASDIAALSRRIVTETSIEGIYYSTQDVRSMEQRDAIHADIIGPSDKTVLKAVETSLNILHICGYEGHRNNIKHFVDYPAHVINWACVVEQLSLNSGKELFGGRPVIGGFANTKDSVLYKGSKDEIQAQTRRLLSESGRQGVILGADCTLPRDINLEHLRWVREAAT
ncbi:uroporphyrinogen decarboxylase family protein [Breznakiellaceae bacterium SP9]